MPWTATGQASLSSTVSWSLPKLTSIVSMILSNHLILCCPILLLRLILPSIRVFSSELALCIRQPKYWSFNFSISPSNECSGLVSFRIDLFDLLAVQGTLKSLLQTTVRKNQFFSTQPFFMVQLSHLYITPGKTIALTIWTFISKVMSVLKSILKNTLCRFVIGFLPRSKASFNFMTAVAVILEPKKIKSVSVSIDSMEYVKLSHLSIHSLYALAYKTLTWEYSLKEKQWVSSTQKVCCFLIMQAKLSFGTFFFFKFSLDLIGTSFVAQMVKNLPAVQETHVQSLGQEDPLEKGMATHSSIFAWRTPWRKEPGELQSMG